MTGLDDREQRYAYLAAGLAGVVSVALWAPAFDERAGLALAGIGLVMASLLAAAARRRHRLFTGLAAVLLAFGPWGMAWVVGLPFLMLAAWLALKSPRLRPRTDPDLDENGEIVALPASRPTKEPRPPRAPRRRRWRGRGGAGGDEDDDALAATPGGAARRATPPPSKRYTPPQRRP